jgi:hypothetical protein
MCGLSFADLIYAISLNSVGEQVYAVDYVTPSIQTATYVSKQKKSKKMSVINLK